jgi:pimeloyl-ACP methyl ester carboxylesterase
MSKVIYCISGLGADEKIFTNLKVNGHELKYLSWLRPEQNETINHYAERMAKPINHDKPIILGVSFGGMMGIEIARQMHLRKLVIISSIKSTSELPGWMKVAGSLRLNKILPVRSYKITEKIDNNRLGVSTKEEIEMVRAYRQKVDPVYFHWAVHQVLNWKNDWQPDNLIHIHGDKDKIFPIKKIRPTHIVKEGTHMMIYNRAKEIGNYIEKELQ